MHRFCLTDCTNENSARTWLRTILQVNQNSPTLLPRTPASPPLPTLTRRPQWQSGEPLSCVLITLWVHPYQHMSHCISLFPPCSEGKVVYFLFVSLFNCLLLAYRNIDQDITKYNPPNATITDSLYLSCLL